MKYTPLLLLTVAALAAVARAGDDPAAAKAKAAIQKLDADGDGRVARSEFLGSDSIFDRWDADKDGFLTEAEFAAGLAAPKPKPEPKRGSNAGGDGPRSDPRRAREQAKGVLARLDKDGDGKLAGEEIPKRGEWSRMDRDGDGALDEAELAAGLEARGRGRGPDLAQRLIAMDADKDGRVSREEWKGRAESFARVDADQDGFVTKAEIEEVAKRMRRRGGWKDGPAEALFRRMDADGDKKITKAEWKLKPELFDRFDANGDGAITADEVMPADPRAAVPEGDRGAGFLKRFDKNGDGKVEAAEFDNERRFAAMDRDGDGVLSKAEIEQALDKQDRERGMSFVERFDRDRDGKVTREEFSGPARVFDRMDRNGDGVVDAQDKSPKEDTPKDGTPDGTPKKDDPR